MSSGFARQPRGQCQWVIRWKLAPLYGSQLRPRVAKMASGPDKTERSYLSSAIESINPWTPSRTATQPEGSHRQEEPCSGSTISKPIRPLAAEDHSTTPFYGQSLRSYPSDCPELSVRWYHAVDVPKRKPVLVKSDQAAQTEARLPAPPKKFVAFPLSDSTRIENGYQRQLEVAEDKRRWTRLVPQPLGDVAGGEQAETLAAGASTATRSNLLIPVQEDFLFDVDIEKRELCPVYWLGPVYEIRRGTWFYQEGSSLRPCEENLASQLEEGYLKLRPWTNSALHRSRPTSRSPTPDARSLVTKSQTEVAQGKLSSSQAATARTVPPAQAPPLPSYRLFGAYMNNIATYQDASIAWLTSDNMLSWVATSVYEKFAGGGHLSGVKLLRGFTEIHRTREGADRSGKEDLAAPVGNKAGIRTERQKQFGRDADLPTSPLSYKNDPTSSNDEGSTSASPALKDLGDEQNDPSDEGARGIDHLILVTHGIGQRMGLRMESINFVNDVDVLRKTLKSVYSSSADLKNLTSEYGLEPGNCRVQVLPVCWRHKVEFPRPRATKLERDLGVTTKEEDNYPSLEDITVEGVAFARSLISDLALDVLLYQSSYRREITQIVLEESNRIFQLFVERNPGFHGKVHLMGHSLGSAILFDLLCRKKSSRGRDEEQQSPVHKKTHRNDQTATGLGRVQCLNFEVDDLYCLGSPIGLFQMLRGSTIAARSSLSARSLHQHFDPDDPNSHLPRSSAESTEEFASPINLSSPSVASPAVAQLFNIFHPSDPISYRLEPLISPAMTSLKPQPLPYTKRGIFGSVAPQGLTSIGAKVGQSVSGLWSSLSAGIASNILKSSLGLANEEMMEMSQQQIEAKNDTAKANSLDPLDRRDPEEEQRLVLPEYLAGERQNAMRRAREASNGNEFETLSSKVECNAATSLIHEENDEYQGLKKKKLQIEESKVRALNYNGRVDYSIQESALDFNPINAIASHMSYWADEDVSHFLLSQLLIRHSKVSIKQ